MASSWVNGVVAEAAFFALFSAVVLAELADRTIARPAAWRQPQPARPATPTRA